MDPDINDVLMDFAVEPVHDRKTLVRYLKLYPQHAVEIACLSHELTRRPTLRELTITEQEWIKEAWDRFKAAMKPG